MREEVVSSPVRRLFSNSESERGSSMLELALILPVIASLLFGIIQWGLIFSAYITVRNAAMVGTRECALWLGDNSTAGTKAKNALAPALSLDATSCPSGGLSPCATCACSKTGDSICSMNYSLHIFFPFVVPGSSGARFKISAQSTMH